MAASNVSEFPAARCDSVALVRDGKLMLWGGYTQIILGEGDDRFIVNINLPDEDSTDRSLEVFDLDTMKWHKQQTSGSSFPVFGKGAFSAVNGNHFYVFGGMDDEDYRNELYGLNLKSFSWKKLSNVNAPTARCYGGMVAHREYLVLFGGVGTNPKDLDADLQGAEVVVNPMLGGAFPNAWTNSLHQYDTVTDIWHVVSCKNKPPPMERFSFDKIDGDRALLFGGKMGLFVDEKDIYNDIFILDLDTKVWEGPFGPTSDAQTWPSKRGMHATTCLVDPESEQATAHQQIVMFWGEDKKAVHLPDIWVLHVQSRTWQELKIPPLFPRKYLMCASHFLDHGQTDVIIFGGNKRRQTKFERNVITGLVIFRFGSVCGLQDMCVRYIRDKIGQDCLSLLPLSLRERVQEEEANRDYSFYYITTEFCS